MNFQKYQHVERLNSPETRGITDGKCYIFPKLDGTNASLWWNNSGIQAGSRNRHLSEGKGDNAGFLNAMQEDDNIFAFLENNHVFRLFGEWLVPHSLKTYADDAWRKFYVFDVMDDEGKYLPYESYAPMLDAYGINCIPPIATVTNPTDERLHGFLEEAKFLIKDGEGSGEGIVIKNYDFVNRHGRTTWAKIVSNEFKAKHTKEMGVRDVKEKALVEEAIVAEFLTTSMVDKVHAKIVNDNDGFSNRDIPRLLGEVYYDLVREELWAALKKFKQPTISFKFLNRACCHHVRTLKPELFA